MQALSRMQLSAGRQFMRRESPRAIEVVVTSRRCILSGLFSLDKSSQFRVILLEAFFWAVLRRESSSW